jgi:hypothetical protein
MSSGYYHNPPKPVSTRVRCPVCHEEVYSRAGIHPQCAVKQSESPKPEQQAVVVVASPHVGAKQAARQARTALSDAQNLGITSTPQTPAPLITPIAVPPGPA